MRINWWVGILLFVASIGAKGDDSAVEDLEETKTHLKTRMADQKRSDLDLDISDDAAVEDLEETKADLKTSDDAAVGDQEDTKTNLKSAMAELKRSDADSNIFDKLEAIIAGLQTEFSAFKKSQAAAEKKTTSTVSSLSSTVSSVSSRVSTLTRPFICDSERYYVDTSFWKKITFSRVFLHPPTFMVALSGFTPRIQKGTDHIGIFGYTDLDRRSVKIYYTHNGGIWISYIACGLLSDW